MYLHIINVLSSPNKRGGVRIIGGLETVRHNNNRGGWSNRGGGLLGKIENSLFLRQTRIYLLYIYVNSDVTDTFTFELWFC